MKRIGFTPRDKNIPNTWAWVSGHLKSVLLTKTLGLSPVPSPVPFRCETCPAQAQECRGLINGPSQLDCSPWNEVSAKTRGCAYLEPPPNPRQPQDHAWVSVDFYSRPVLLKTLLCLTCGHTACRGEGKAHGHGAGLSPHMGLKPPGVPWATLRKRSGQAWCGGDRFPHTSQQNGTLRTLRTGTSRSLCRCTCQGRRRDYVVLNC